MYVQVKAPLGQLGQEEKIAAAKKEIIEYYPGINEGNLVMIPVKYDYEEFWQWAAILDRFAASSANTLGITAGLVGKNHADNVVGEVVYPSADSPRAERGAWKDYRTTVNLVTLYLQRTLEALPRLLGQLNIPVDAVGVVVGKDQSPYGGPIITSASSQSGGGEVTATSTAAVSATSTAADSLRSTTGAGGAADDATGSGRILPVATPSSPQPGGGEVAVDATSTAADSLRSTTGAGGAMDGATGSGRIRPVATPSSSQPEGGEVAVDAASTAADSLRSTAAAGGAADGATGSGRIRPVATPSSSQPEGGEVAVSATSTTADSPWLPIGAGGAVVLAVLGSALLVTRRVHRRRA